MSLVQKMQQFVAQRLHAAAEEILAVFEETIVKYEQEAALNQEVISRQHALLCALRSPLMDLKSTDIFTQQLMVSKDTAPLEDKNQNQNQHQNQDPEPSQVKDEQDGEQLHLDEADIIKFTYSSSCTVRSSEDLDQSAGPGPAGTDQDVLLVSSSETEDSEDYNRDFYTPRPPPDRPKRRGSGGGFICQVCSQTFRTRRFLFKHVKIHLQEVPFVCGVCSERFEAADGLKRHLQTHLKMRPLQNQKGTETRTGTWSSGRQRLNTNIQEEQKPDRCDDCGKQVWNKRRHRCRTWRKKQNQKGPEETKKKKKKT